MCSRTPTNSSFFLILEVTGFVTFFFNLPIVPGDPGIITATRCFLQDVLEIEAR